MLHIPPEFSLRSTGNFIDVILPGEKRREYPWIGDYGNGFALSVEMYEFMDGLANFLTKLTYENE